MTSSDDLIDDSGANESDEGIGDDLGARFRMDRSQRRKRLSRASLRRIPSDTTPWRPAPRIFAERMRGEHAWRPQATATRSRSSAWSGVAWYRPEAKACLLSGVRPVEP